jgi:hypothetical protein
MGKKIGVKVDISSLGTVDVEGKVRDVRIYGAAVNATNPKDGEWSLNLDLADAKIDPTPLSMKTVGRWWRKKTSRSKAAAELLRVAKILLS